MTIIDAGFRARLMAIVNEQAEDDALWAEPLGGFPAPEAYVLQALRRLHAAIEEDASDAFDPDCG